MTSLVSDFLINPVIRQARRFSAGRGNDVDAASPGRRMRAEAMEVVDQAISEMDEGVMHFDDIASPLAIPGRPMPDFEGTGSSFAETTPGSASLSRSASALLPPVETTASEYALEDAADVRIPQDATGYPSRSTVRLPLESWNDGDIPEDDGRRDLRQRILKVQDMGISSQGKARLMHQLIMEDFTRSQVASGTGIPERARLDMPMSPSQAPPLGALESLKHHWDNLRDSVMTPDAPVDFKLRLEDLQPTFAPMQRPNPDASLRTNGGSLLDERPLGCEHYKRNVKLQCAECERWYTCRFCHDAAETHALPRRSTKHMLCMLCGTAQKANDICIKCGELSARYYCGICKLWNDDPEKAVYHCNDCGICRVGKGLGKDFYHCKRCNACIAFATETTHKCIERSLDCDCPICGEYMFTSPRVVIFMKCGHSIHNQCWQEYLQNNYKCPICNKSTVNMETQFRNLDIAIATQPMPAEFQNCRAIVLCNDCCTKSATKYHWLGLKCMVCNSYNTAELRMFTEQEVAQNPGLLQGYTSPVPQQTVREFPLARAEGAASAVAELPADPFVSRQSALHLSVDMIPQRDTSTQVVSPLLLPARLARSASPAPTPLGIALSQSGTEHDAEDWQTDEDDIIDFWGRDDSRNVTTAGTANSVGSHADSDGDSDDCEEEDVEEEEDEDEEEEEEEIALFGHR